MPTKIKQQQLINTAQQTARNAQPLINYCPGFTVSAGILLQTTAYWVYSAANSMIW
jgi:hypothetical protein